MGFEVLTDPRPAGHLEIEGQKMLNSSLCLPAACATQLTCEIRFVRQADASSASAWRLFGRRSDA
eukprot:7087106-Pyramimonas_sp.AAC.1